MANNIIACDPVTCYSRTEIVDAEPTMTSPWISLEPNSLIEFREEQSGDASSFSKIQRARFLDLVRKFEFHRRNSVTNVRGVATNFVNRLRDIVEWKGLVLKPMGGASFIYNSSFQSLKCSEILIVSAPFTTRERISWKVQFWLDA